jgi:3-methyladenine DNA glycosylase/8-oxoguanine DNA glycosylase
VDVHLVSPGLYGGANSGSGEHGERLHQVDLRVSKLLNFAGTRTRLNVDVYNALNSSAVLSQNNTFDAWQTPLEILVARFYKFSVQVDF